MEILIILFAIVIVYLIVKSLSGKSSQKQLQRSEEIDDEDGIEISSSPGVSIVLRMGDSDLSRPRHKPIKPDTAWIPPGETIKIKGREIIGGMLYVADYLQSAGGYVDPEPALVRPKLKVNWSSPDYTGSKMSYWPSYSDIDPSCRAAYLEWLTTGKSDPQAYIGYVFLYFYGLERRALVDAKGSEIARSDIPMIVKEVKRLIGIYGGNGSFDSYANGLLNAIYIIQNPQSVYKSSPPEEKTSWELPLKLIVGLGQLSSEGKPIPANWAYSWVILHPDMCLRTPATRCKEEFKKLFHIRYAEKYGEGMVVKPNKTRLVSSYSSASLSLPRPLEVPCGDLPDLGRLTGPVNRLRKIVDQCTDVLDPYSRFLGRRPEARESLAAVALLPPELVHSSVSSKVTKMKEWLRNKAGDSSIFHVNSSELIAMWPSVTGDRLTKNESVSLAQMLEKFSYGVEPDPRFGGANLKASEKAVLFRLTKDVPKVASQQYSAAAVLLHLAAAISGADGIIADSERDYIKTHLEEALEMSDGEKVRLQAHLDWLLHSPPGLAGIKKRVESLTAEEKKAIGAFCVGVAGVDGHIDPSEIKALTKLYPLLGLATDDVFLHIHSMMSISSVPSVDEPVKIQPADLSLKGFAIPSPQNINEMKVKGVILDMNAVQLKIKETDAVSNLLSSIFQDEECKEIPTEEEQDDVETIGPLDVAHSKFLRTLAGKLEWSRSEYEELASRFGLLPDGALDTINEAALDICEELVCEGDDPIIIELNIAKEMID